MTTVENPGFHIYSSGDIEGKRIDYILRCDSWKRLCILHSYAKFKSVWHRQLMAWVLAGNRPYRFMLDSGAFSAATGTCRVTLPGYIDFVHHLGDQFDIVVTLDDITSPVTTQDNTKRMLDAGIPKEKILPVYHYGEDPKFLSWIVKQGFKYIGLGGVARGVPRPVIQHWVHWAVYNYPPGKDGFKFHLFGCGDRQVLERYPVYSCDSVTPLLGVYLRGSSASMNKNRGVIGGTGAKFNEEMIVQEATALVRRQAEIGSRWKKVHGV